MNALQPSKPRKRIGKLKITKKDLERIEELAYNKGNYVQFAAYLEIHPTSWYDAIKKFPELEKAAVRGEERDKEELFEELRFLQKNNQVPPGVRLKAICFQLERRHGWVVDGEQNQGRAQYKGTINNDNRQISLSVVIHGNDGKVRKLFEDGGSADLRECFTRKPIIPASLQQPEADRSI